MNYMKMHGAGNGFVLLNNTGHQLDDCDFSALAIELCEKENLDGLIRIESSPDGDVGMVFYNRDGSEGEMCGNGARCLARYAVEQGLAEDPDHIRLRTKAGLVQARRIDRENYEVRLNDPSVVDLHRSVSIGQNRLDCFYTELGSPGIPHAVVFMSDPPPADLSELRSQGKALRHASAFPKGANVTFAWQTGPDELYAMTYERGVEDFTLACGTGCGATAAALVLLGRSEAGLIQIHMPGGDLSVRLTRDGTSFHDLFLQGPTAVIGEGTVFM